jgi:hypothetical protein
MHRDNLTARRFLFPVAWALRAPAVQASELKVRDISTGERSHFAPLKAATDAKPGPPRFGRDADIGDAPSVVPGTLASKGLMRVGPLPPDLGMPIDVVAAKQAAQALIGYVGRPSEIWKAHDRRLKSQ